MSETALMREVRAALYKLGIVAFRNNVGRLRNIHGTMVSYGLCAGSSDLIGWRTTTITADMVGKPVAIFTAVEVKRPTVNLTNSQNVFLSAVRAAGGIAFVARDMEDIRPRIAVALQCLGEGHDAHKL